MKNRNLLKILLLLIVVAKSLTAAACTSVIVSGRATKDGRPMILKNRDSGNYDNLSVVVQGERYRYLAIVGAKDTKPVNAWMGHNEKGFAIINTAAYNLNGKEPDGDRDGELMRRALEVCASLEEFEHLLDTLQRPIGVNANFGVIDANGGCAYYETGNKGYVKFDANDPHVAPYGYLVRTNHALSGDRAMDKGVERYMAITDFMMNADFCDQIDKDYLLRGVARNLKHGFTQIDLYKQIPESEAERTIVPFKDFIPRYQSTSCVLIQGVRQGEDPLLTVSWTMVGSPLTTVAIPLLITPDAKLPSIVTRGDDGYAWLTKAGLTLKGRIFPLKRGNYTEYIDLSKLINRQNTGILQRVLRIEDEVLQRGNSVVDAIRERGKIDKSLTEYYSWVDKYVTEQYAEQFGVE